MATLKKQRQRKTMEIKRKLGIDIALARRVARCVLDYTKWVRVGGFDGKLTNIEDLLTAALGQSEYRPGCECCGNSSHTWRTKRGFITIPVSGAFEIESF